MSMMKFKVYIIVISFFSSQFCTAQKERTQENYLKEFHQIDSIVHQNFNVDKIHTLNQNEIEELIQLYYKEIEILDKIEEEERLKFFMYKFRGGDFMLLDLLNEANKNMELSYTYFYQIKGELDDYCLLHAYLGYVDLAKNYTRLNKMDKAMMHYKNALQFTRKYYTDLAHEATALNNIGIHFFENLNKKDSAMTYFSRAQEIMLKESDKKRRTFLGSIRDNIANVYLEEGKYEKANELFKQNYTFYSPKNYALAPDYERWLRAGLQIGETNLKLGETERAKRIFDEINTKIKQYTFLEKSSIRLRYLRDMEHFYTIKRNHKKAYQYALKKQNLIDSISREKKSEIATWNDKLQQISIRRIKKNIEAKQLEKQQIEAEERLKLGVFVGILAIITLILLYLFIRYQQKIKEEEKAKYIAEQEASLLELNNELLNKDIALKKNDLTDAVTQLSQNQKWIKTLADKIKKIQLTQGRERANILETIEQEVSTHLQENQSTQEFNQRVAQLSDEFYKKLEKEFPKLTKADIKLCAMIRLGIGNNEIAILQNINPSSVHQSRYRLKKKLNIEEDLDIFLENM